MAKKKYYCVAMDEPSWETMTEEECKAYEALPPIDNPPYEDIDQFVARVSVLNNWSYWCLGGYEWEVDEVGNEKCGEYCEVWGSDPKYDLKDGRNIQYIPTVDHIDYEECTCSTLEDAWDALIWLRREYNFTHSARLGIRIWDDANKCEIDELEIEK